MKKNNFADRLNLCLDKEGFPPKNKGRIQLLAEMVGLSHRGASKWINGESVPPRKKYTALAKKLNVSEHWLRTGEGSMYISRQSANKLHHSYEIEVNIYDVDSFLHNTQVVGTLKCSLPHEGPFFGISLDSEAMSPRFPKGCLIIFDECEAKDGDFVLVRFKEFPNPIFRQLLIAGGILYLQAHNPKFDRLVLTSNEQILGRLVQAILSFGEPYN
ncbi:MULTISPECIES: LexA family protein [Legionella]|nr:MULTISPECIES: S24 family peptidase [Legionella]MCP0913759.1 helix-turn-helix domain-containing protein [Legionella sp. 27cVA30]